MTTSWKKRAWHYIYSPEYYEVACDNGGAVNPEHKIAWSEYEGMIWCYDCKQDMKGFGGIFDGPIPYELSLLIFGKYCFHRFDIIKKVVRVPVQSKTSGRIAYRIDKAATKKFLSHTKQK